MPIESAMNVSELFENISSDKELLRMEALVFYKNGSPVNRVSYGELNNAVLNYSALLQKQYKIEIGDKIAILSKNSIEFPIMVLAIAILGAIAIPLNPNSSKDEWKYIISHAKINGIFYQDYIEDSVNNLEINFLFSSKFPKLDLSTNFNSLLDKKLSNYVYLIMYTSGTTGRPKGVSITQENIIFCARKMAENFNLKMTRQMSMLPLYHAHALGFGLMTSLVTGGCFIFSEKFDPLNWESLIKNESVQVTSVFPTLLPIICDYIFDKSNLKTLKHIMATSSPLQSDIVKKFEMKSDVPIYNAWGMTEASCLATCMPVEINSELRELLLYNHATPSIGKSLTDIEVGIFDKDGNFLGPNNIGELCIRGDSVMKCYLSDIEATDKTIINGWLHSGDEGYFILHDNEKYFFITGRIKETIIKGGEKYSPASIEELIFDIEPTLYGKLAVVGFSHSLYGEEIGIYLENKDGTNLNHLLNALRNIGHDKKPKVILHGDNECIKTHTGKMQRNRMKGMFKNYEDYIGNLVVNKL